MASAGWEDEPISIIEEMAAVGGWELNLQTEELVWSDGTRKIFEVSADFEPSLEEAIEFFHPDDRERIQQLIERSQASGEPYNAELRIITDRGNVRWVETRGLPVHDGDTVAYLRGAIMDVTDRKHREQRLMVLNRVLRHNLRNDLNIIAGRAMDLKQKLSELELPAQLRDDEDAFLTRLLSEVVDSAEAVYDDVKDVERGIEAMARFPIESAKDNTDSIIEKSEGLVEIGSKARRFEEVIGTDRDREAVEIQPILEEVVDGFRHRYPDARIELTSEGALSTYGNRGMLVMAFEQIVENAIIHKKSEIPTVEITATPIESGAVQVSIRDNGPGIPELERQVLEEGEETPLMHGSGIGLWIVNWIVARHEGVVSIRERNEGGTAVNIELPELS